MPLLPLLALSAVLSAAAAVWQGDFVVEYMGPEPGKGTHRYALLMFEQPGFQQITPPTKRAFFQTKHVSTGGRLLVWGRGHSVAGTGGA